MNNPIFEIKSLTALGASHVTAVLDIVDEQSLLWIEKRYPGRLSFDGCRTYTMTVVVSVAGLVNDATIFERLKTDHPEIVMAHIMRRLKGEI